MIDIIIFIMADKPSALPVFEVLQAILKRYDALLFRKLSLYRAAETEPDSYIRHYDIQCESSTNIKDIIQTAQQRRKIEAFMNIKNFAFPRFARSHCRRSISVGNKGIITRKQSGNENTKSCRSSSVSRNEIPNNEEVQQIFNRVRSIANSSLSRTPSKNQSTPIKSSVYGFVKKREQFLKRLMDLESDFSELVETERKLNTKQVESSSRTRRAYPERRRNIRMIDVNIS